VRLLLLLTACAPKPTSQPPDSQPITLDDSGPADTGDSAASILGFEPHDPHLDPLAQTDHADVVIIGSGAAGLAAGIAAREEGASVVILERDDKPGNGITYATRAFAVGTSYQEAAGIADSADNAASEWPSITGVEGDTPAVYDFLAGSAETLDWLIGLGFAYTGLASDEDSGSVARLHTVRGEDTRLALVADFDGDLRTGVEADALVQVRGRVRGVRWTDLETGEQGVTWARAVIVATGGFLRDRAKVDEVRPDLAGRDLLVETSPQATGGGLGLLDDVGAAWANQGELGLYVHAIQDPDRDPGEALIFGAMDQALFVDASGARFADERNSRSLLFFDVVPGDDVYVVAPDAIAGSYMATRPDYNRDDPMVEQRFGMGDLVLSSPDVVLAATPSELAGLAGIDADGLEATIAEVTALAEIDGVDGFGRDFGGGLRFDDDLWWSIHLKPGLAKGFGGVATDEQARVLDASGQPIPGLYAAGEVAGMLPGGGAGTGFSGSVLACYHYGRVAGEEAARAD